MRIDADFSKTYSYGKSVFCGLQFHLADGEIMSLLGGVGAGKTTLLKCVAGVTDFDGKIEFDGKPLKTKQDDVMMLFDDGALFENYTVFDNLAYPLKIRKVDKKEIAKKVIEVANVFHLHSILNYKIKRLTLEERKLVTLSRTLMRSASVLLIDDLLGGLPKGTRETLWKELAVYLKNSKKTIIYSTTDRNEALSIADKVMIMNEYGIKQIGRADEIYSKPQSYWALEAVDESAFCIKGKLCESDGKLTLDFLGMPLDVSCLKKRLLTESYIGAEVLIGMHAEDVYKSESGIKQKATISICVGKQFLTEFESGVKMLGDKCDEAEILPKVEKIMLFDAATENSILKG
ncbi:MAG: ATP-binding cassette domain-containing protein [Firmicutes bacterium]|nr:ATP-binding cassette domain-containing protein [Bacillota bacterium]